LLECGSPIQRYCAGSFDVPELERRWNRRARPIHSSWRVDETYVQVRARWHYPYRAVGKFGKTIDFLLRPNRGVPDAQAFFRKTNHMAIRLLCRENYKSRKVLVRSCRYLNNIVEQDHRAIKRRCAVMMGFKSLRTASIALAGIEIAHRIRKSQFVFGPGRLRRNCSLREQWERALA
jgi:transposase-like protein